MKYEMLDESATEHNFNVIRVVDGEFKDYTFYYETVNISEKEDGFVYLKFTYTVINGDHVMDAARRTRLDTALGDILVEVIEDYAEGQGIETGTTDPQGTD